MKKAIIGLLLLTTLVIGCIMGPSTNCGNDMECIEKAINTCENATGFQEVKNSPPIEAARIDITVRRVSDSNCLMTQTLSNLDIQEGALLQGLEGSSPPGYLLSDNYKTFLENFASFYFPRFNAQIRDNLPFTISCYARIVDGNTVTADLEECARSQQNKLNSILGEGFSTFIDETTLEIEEQESVLKDISLKLGEINEIGYEKGAEKTDFYSEGISYAIMFAPNGAQTQVNELTFNSFKLNYTITGLEEGSFAIAQGIVFLEDSDKAGSFYQSAYNKFISSQSSQKITEGFHGPHSAFVKVQADSKLESYRFIYQEKNIIVMLDLVPKEIDLSEVVEKLESISSTLNSRLNPEAEPISLDCEVSSVFEEVCRTVGEMEEYQEEECSTRQYNYQATQPIGTYSEGLFGYGCYTEVTTTVSNQENVDGAFTFQVEFLDAEGNTITTLQDSKMVSPNYTQTLSVNYPYDCSISKPQNYTHTFQAPTAEFCSMVTKTKEVPKEVCEEEEIQELACN